KRMERVWVESYSEYMEMLESQPAEFGALFDMILINVTSFLRDRDAWGFVQDTVVAEMVARSDATGGDLRIWSAGCASGEEPYSLAVLLAERLGDDRFRSSVKIYATDADE